MDKQIKTFLIAVSVALAILYLARPKNNILDSKPDENKLAPPKKVNKEASQKNQDGNVIIDAMRTAIEANEKQSEIDKLNAVFLKEYRMKVFYGKDNKLVAKTIDGKIVAKEA